MAAAAPDQRLLFATTFEALLVRAYPDRITPPLKRQLAADGVDLDHPFLPAYPLGTWLKVLRTVTENVAPGVDHPTALRDVGRRFIAGYFETMLGKTTLPLLRLLGPLRTFRRMTQNFRAGNNFIETELTEAAPNDVTMVINHCLAEDPRFIQGLLEHGLELIRAPTPSLEVVSHSSDGRACYRARWGA
ncbi:MAG: DUF2378 family protein [Archangiaceae bacterium]|nr:DUF2378 family protein [Archangiaceae bacterium]